MDDLISRQAAIKKILGQPPEPHYPSWYAEQIKELPHAKPKRGKWIYCEDSMADCVDGYRCDQCGFFVPWDYTHKGIDFIQDYNFCPSCGARMEVNNESN